MSQPITHETLDLLQKIGNKVLKESIKKGSYSPDPILNSSDLQPQSDVQAWLRGKGIHIEPQFSRNSTDSGYEWWFYLYPKMPSGGRIKFFPHEIGEGLTYEGALEVGLQEGLKLI